MNCSKIEYRILKGEKSEDIAEHLENCLECRNLMESMELIEVDIGLGRYEIPSELENTILKESKKRCNYKQKKLINFFVYAAGFIIVAGIITSMIFSSTQEKRKVVNGASLCPYNSISDIQVPVTELDEEFSGIESELDMLDTDISSIEDDYSQLMDSDNSNL
jgi:hypothetical protein